MSLNLAKEVATLNRLSVADLRARFAVLFGEPTRTGNRAWLIKRIAWRQQVLAHGDLSQRARQRAADLANDADLRLLPPRPPNSKTANLPPTPQSDGRLPLPGTILTRAYKGATLHVRVLNHGFEYDGALYPSLSAVANAITGSHCNGFLFFRLTHKPRQQP